MKKIYIPILIGLFVVAGSFIQDNCRMRQKEKLLTQIEDCRQSSESSKSELENMQMKLDSRQSELSALEMELRDWNLKVEKAGVSQELAEDIDVIAEKRIRELIEKQEGYSDEIKETLLYVMKQYYAADIGFSTDEGSMGDLFTDSIISTLSGGSSTAEAALKELKDGLSAEQSADEIKTAVVVTALDELPREIFQKTMEYMMDKTVMKALNIWVNLQPSNKQLQFLLNELNQQTEYYRSELVHMMAAEKLTVEDMRNCTEIAGNLYDIAWQIEGNTDADAGSEIWKFCYFDCSAFYESSLEIANQIEIYQSFLEDARDEKESK